MVEVCTLQVFSFLICKSPHQMPFPLLLLNVFSTIEIQSNLQRATSQRKCKITFRTGLKTTFQKMIYFDLLFICMMIKQKLLKLNLRISFKLDLLIPFDSLQLTVSIRDIKSADIPHLTSTSSLYISDIVFITDWLNAP